MHGLLTEAQATKCELAQEPRCRCRCGGKLHGARRVGTRQEFEALPENDPHKVAPLAPRASVSVRRVLGHALKYVQRKQHHEDWPDVWANNYAAESIRYLRKRADGRLPKNWREVGT